MVPAALYGYRCDVAGYRFYGLGDLEGIATTDPLEAHCFGFLQAALRALILLAVVLTIPSPTFTVIAKVEPSTLAIITVFFIPVGGRDGKR